MTPGRCKCACHRCLIGTATAAQQMGRYMEALSWQRRAELWEPMDVATTDALEAAVACRACQNDHCPALSTMPGRAPRITRVYPRFDPNGDSQQVRQADGDQGEGPES